MCVLYVYIFSVAILNYIRTVGEQIKYTERKEGRSYSRSSSGAECGLQADMHLQPNRIH